MVLFSVGWIFHSAAHVPVGLYHDPDLNNDHYVNFLDLALLVGCIDTSAPFEGDLRACELSDFNNDSAVNSIDVQLFADRFFDVFPTTEEAENLFGLPVIQPLTGSVRYYKGWFDINNDGWQDLYHTGIDETKAGRILSITVYVAHGDGTFSVPITTDLLELEVNNFEDEVAFADFDSDGVIDLFLKEKYVQKRSLIFKGIGDGSFDISFNDISVFANPEQRDGDRVFADVNSDNIPDLIVDKSGEVSVYHGDGELNYNLAATYPITTNPDINLNVSVRNFNQDLTPDLLVEVIYPSSHGNVNGFQCLNMYAGIGGGMFSAEEESVACEDRSLGGPHIADINNDGLQDVVFRDNLVWG